MPGLESCSRGSLIVGPWASHFTPLSLSLRLPGKPWLLPLGLIVSGEFLCWALSRSGLSGNGQVPCPR